MAARAACRLLAAALLATGARANCRGLDRAALITLYEALGCSSRSFSAPRHDSLGAARRQQRRRGRVGVGVGARLGALRRLGRKKDV